MELPERRTKEKVQSKDKQMSRISFTSEPASELSISDQRKRWQRVMQSPSIMTLFHPDLRASEATSRAARASAMKGEAGRGSLCEIQAIQTLGESRATTSKIAPSKLILMVPAGGQI
ncbi:hypothetical protein Salat_2148200 [Sesamum alatum]|uniref:Uncharacterized protein n=1 Tax=Sesamum alatum TaxID=300844 RepID=A0AAE1Y1F8_9LAMI|nr:hypothetical protein Salat_2148200 [Sesamum alatum]